MAEDVWRRVALRTPPQRCGRLAPRDHRGTGRWHSRPPSRSNHAARPRALPRESAAERTQLESRTESSARPVGPRISLLVRARNHHSPTASGRQNMDASPAPKTRQVGRRLRPGTGMRSNARPEFEELPSKAYFRADAYDVPMQTSFRKNVCIRTSGVLSKTR